MKPDQDDHGAGSPVVQPVDEPSEGNFDAEIIEAVVGTVDHRDEVEQLPYPGDDLQKKDNEDRAAEDVGITGPAGHLFFEAQTQEGLQGPALVDPAYHFPEQSHGYTDWRLRISPPETAAVS